MSRRYIAFYVKKMYKIWCQEDVLHFMSIRHNITFVVKNIIEFDVINMKSIWYQEDVYHLMTRRCIELDVLNM